MKSAAIKSDQFTLLDLHTNNTGEEKASINEPLIAMNAVDLMHVRQLFGNVIYLSHSLGSICHGSMENLFKNLKKKTCT